jgi:Tol biopolymer transport system component
MWMLGATSSVSGQCSMRWSRGVRAFSGPSTAETLSAVLRAQPKLPSEIAPDVPSDLEKVILRCLRKDPDRRFQHIGDIKIALQEIKEDSDSGTAAAVILPRTTRLALLVALGGTLVLLIAIATWLMRPERRLQTPPLRVVPLTTLVGHEGSPTFSPDGEHVAFTWDGEGADNLDIYVTIVGSSEVRRLTTDPARDFNPAWSPNGRQSAFLREGREGSTIQIVSPLSGSDQKLSSFHGASSLTWSPDSRWIAVGRSHSVQAVNGGDGAGGIYLIPLRGGEPHAIIRSKPSTTSDFLPALSPDGRRLAYASCRRDLTCHVYLTELDAAAAATAPPRQLTNQELHGVGSLAWTRDGRSVVYDAGRALGLTYLWRLGISEHSQPERIEVAGLGATSPSTAGSRDRLAFAHVRYDTDIYRFEPGRSAQSVAASTFRESEPRLSGDGRRLAFCSLRSGDNPEVWVAAADGSGARQLTDGPGQIQGSPWWSPDGSRIAFDSLAEDGHFHIWTVDADGGTPRQLTNDRGDQNVPTWSRDGRWIYFSADHGAGREIWRIAATSGPSQQVTRGGSGLFACESFDGKSLLYQPKDIDSPLLALPVGGGAVRQLVACVKPTAFGAGPQGVYYVACDPSPDPALHLMDPDSGRDRLLGRLENFENSLATAEVTTQPGVLPLGLGVSPEGKSILYIRHMSDGADLMLIENFR